MKIKILGTRGEIDFSLPYHSKHSGLLIDKGLLFDMGEKEFLKHQPKYIFLTHLHPDHAFFIRSNEKLINLFSKKVPLIFAPEKDRVNSELINLIKPLQRIKFKNYQVFPIPTHHSKKVKSTAYLIQRGKKRILYTGDMIWIDKRYHSLLNNLDLVITEGSFIKKGGMIRKDSKTGKIYGHTGIPDLINLFKRFTKTIVLIHFGAWFYRDTNKAREKIKKLAKENNIDILVGYDGKELTV